MTNPPYIVTVQTLTFYDGATPYSVHVSSPNYQAVLKQLQTGVADMEALVALANDVAKIQQGIEEVTVDHRDSYLVRQRVTVDRSGVRFDGEVVKSALTDRMMEILAAGLPIAPWIRFAENLSMNPSQMAREELYLWLEQSDLPITPDGHFLAYKVVRENYTDIHSGTFDNSVGQVCWMPREEVDPVRDNTCSRGLHFCSKEYLKFYGSMPGKRVVLLKIDPADVVSIPSDYNNAKGRTWRYEVVDEMPQDEAYDHTWAPIIPDYSDEAPYDHDDGYDLDDEYDDVDVDQLIADESDREDTVQYLLDYFGIVDLRRRARDAGMSSQRAWKQADKRELAEYITDHE